MGKFDSSFLVPLLSLPKKLKARLMKPSFRPCTPATPPAIEICVRKVSLGRNPSSISGDYLEFGVYQGYSLLTAYNAAKEVGLEQMRFFGFDSFEGLPEPKGIDAGWKFTKGAYAWSKDRVVKNLTKREIDWTRAFLVDGFYENTLNNNTKAKYGIKEVAIALIDCDLYASSCHVLRFLEDIVRNGTILLFDDWNCFEKDPKRGERRAFKEFLDRNPHISYEEFIPFGWHGLSFILHMRDKI